MAAACFAMIAALALRDQLVLFAIVAVAARSAEVRLQSVSRPFKRSCVVVEAYVVLRVVALSLRRCRVDGGNGLGVGDEGWESLLLPVLIYLLCPLFK